MCGDSDSVCSVVGQIAGSFYGFFGIPYDWVSAVLTWDPKLNIPLRAYKLYKLGSANTTTATSTTSTTTTTTITTTPTTITTTTTLEAGKSEDMCVTSTDTTPSTTETISNSTITKQNDS